ncbi:Beta-ketoadipate enol-lactone hydrolase [Caballeronia sordidicola]|uniref:Beta-ketoadipate enol-lactone hydrolase n=2 Tax=Caballeronia sordidicola TaxID=196367 RepID=A0A242N639_CABSO|nr:Beta-ketoadipate enol-lactone hydrolase [Caballeronia sordidicola]
MIHGYGLQSTGALYAPLYGYLAEAFTIYALDNRAHGASVHLVDGWSYKQMADDIAAAVANLGLKDAMHVGHSYGGFMGLVTELHHPGTFRALNLLAPAAASGGGATPDDLKAAITERGQDRAFMHGLYAGMYRNPPAPEHLDLVLDAVTIMDLRVHETYFWHEFATINIMDRLHEITLPVLMVTGGKDVVVSPEEQRAAAIALPNSKEVSFSDEGHMLPLESPERAAREVIRFSQDIA